MYLLKITQGNKYIDFQELSASSSWRIWDVVISKSGLGMCIKNTDFWAPFQTYESEVLAVGRVGPYV